MISVSNQSPVEKQIIKTVGRPTLSRVKLWPQFGGKFLSGGEANKCSNLDVISKAVRPYA